jgi:stage III sporulation protein SpoIIIAA
MRVGKNFPSSIDLIQEQVDTGKSLLILGKCGSGKTTLLRAIANYLSMRQRKKVVIIDTSNEIAGDGDIPHPAIGRARRMQVPTGRSQAEIMIRAVENHNPDVIIVDEISAGEEAQAAVTIAERGVQLIATAHGRELENLIKNKPLQDLVGGITKVTLSDETADRRNLASKTIQERVTEPPFTIIIEIVAYDEVNIYDDVLQAVDCLLSGGVCKPERRRRLDNTVRVLEKARLQMPSAEDHHQTRNNNHTPPVRSGSRSRQQKTNNGKAH